jgi:hypothetical protein
MQASTLILVSAATVVNLGVWLWALPMAGAAQTECRPAAAASTAAETSANNSASMNKDERPGAAQKISVHAGGLPAAVLPDQSWLSTVRDAALQISQSQPFSDKLTLSDLECQGSKCDITGSTKVSSDGQAHGASDVARLMKAMNDGQIAGGDSGRSVVLNQMQSGPNGVNFSLTVQQEAVVNPCQAIFDLWKQTHPEDALQNPDFFPTPPPVPKIIRQ